MIVIDSIEIIVDVDRSEQRIQFFLKCKHFAIDMWKVIF